jgi:predicted secreted protein
MAGMRRAAPRLALAVVSTVLVGCDGSSGEILLDHPEDSGTTLRLVPGDVVAIPLEVNPGVGFEWELPEPPDGAVLRLLSNEIEIDDPEATGSGGVQTWRFEAVGEGTTRLRFERRYRGDDDPEGQEFRLEIRVSA